MVNIIIFLFLFPIYFCKEITPQEYGVDIPFDQNNNEFHFYYEGEPNDNLVVYIEYSESRLQYEHTAEGQGTYSGSFLPPGTAYVFHLGETKVNHIIKLSNFTTDGKGTLWLNPLKNQISIDLNDGKNYQKKLKVRTAYQMMNKEALIFVTKQFTSDFIYQFDYDEHSMANPFEICHGNDCKDK